MRASMIRLVYVVALLTGTSASAVTMAWTPIGNPGNACDPQPDSVFLPGGCFGAVGYSYDIGTYEVTTAQYAEFLNAKAASDPYALYATFSTSIIRSGNAGHYTYSVAPGRENLPVDSVDFFSAARFANWLNNGQGNNDIQTGSYTLLGNFDTPSNQATLTRNLGATIFVASENEWYKAAYYDPGNASYFAYPTDSNTAPTCTTPTAVPNSANCPGSGVLGRTNVGAYSGSASPYGTFDQGGNLEEWTDTKCAAPCYFTRGGSFVYVGDLAASYRDTAASTAASEYLGFRLVMIPGGYVPEPSTGLLVVAGLLGLAGGRRARA
jgi:sulfatase modifying factor 1